MNTWIGSAIVFIIFSLNGSHSRVVITATLSIDIQSLASRRDGLRDDLTNLESDHRVRNFTLPHGVVQYDPRIVQFAGRIGLNTELTGFKAAGIVIHRLPEIMAFNPNVHKALCGEGIKTILDRGQGDARDCAHVALALLRSIGIPTRFVSGYSFRRGPFAPDTHAWVEALIPSEGWVGIDPALGQMVGESYVALATGRSYDEVQVQRAICRGGGVPRVSERVQRRMAQPVRGEWSPRMPNSDKELAAFMHQNHEPSAKSIEQQILQV